MRRFNTLLSQSCRQDDGVPNKKMPKDRMRWAELLDVLTDSDRNREVVLERTTETRCHYIVPADAAIRFSKQLLYWGFHIFENTKPQLAFRSVGRYSYPRMDFLKLVDYLEFQTEIQKVK